MMFTAPQRRSRVYEDYEAPFPLPGSQEESSPHRDTVYQGELLNNTVLIRHPAHILDIYGKGYFGKGILSRARPDHSISNQWEVFCGRSLPVISQSKYEQQVSLARRALLAQGLDEEVVEETLLRLSRPVEMEDEQEVAGGGEGCEDVPSSAESEEGELDSTCAVQRKRLWSRTETDSHSVEAKAKRPRKSGCTEETLSPRNSDSEQWEGCELLLVVDDTQQQEGNRQVKVNPFTITEYLQLTLEEAFFLVYALGCLSVFCDQEAQSVVQLWRHFRSIQSNFLWSYTAYHYYRSKGWVPKPGLKYGSDFMLYRKGPPFYHASYSVVLQSVDCGAFTTLRSFSWRSLATLNRITANVSKELLLCYIIHPDGLSESDLDSPLCLKKLTVQDIIMSRWISSREREQEDI